MNIIELHATEKPVSAVSLTKSDSGNTTAIQVLNGEKLKKHLTRVPALLICVIGKVIFEDEKGLKRTLMPGDYMHIKSMVNHWVVGVTDSQLILIK